MAFIPAIYAQRQRTIPTAPSTFLSRPSHALRAPRRTHSRARMVSEVEQSTQAPAFSPKGMTAEDFFQRSFGTWRSQRSSHNLAWTQFEAVTSEISIEPRTADDPDVIALCERNKISAANTLLSLGMSWEGESDWDDEETMQGSSLMSVVKDGERHGRLLRSVGYAETVPAVGKWEMTADGVFVLSTFYDAAAAEERIWFATPNLRMRVSQIRTSSGQGVVTASFSTEIRRLNES